MVRAKGVAIYLRDLEVKIIPRSRSLLRGFQNLFDMKYSLFLNHTMDSLETWWVGRPTNVP